LQGVSIAIATRVLDDLPNATLRTALPGSPAPRNTAAAHRCDV